MTHLWGLLMCHLRRHRWITQPDPIPYVYCGRCGYPPSALGVPFRNEPSSNGWSYAVPTDRRYEGPIP